MIDVAYYDNQIATLLSFDLFRRVANNEQISIYSFNVLTNFLVSIGIPYDVSYDPGTRKEAPALELTIHINPTRTEVLVVALTPGSTDFSPTP